LFQLRSGKAPLNGEARDRVRTFEGINPPSLGKTPDTHVLQTVNLTLLRGAWGHLSVNLTLLRGADKGIELDTLPLRAIGS